MEYARIQAVEPEQNNGKNIKNAHNNVNYEIGEENISDKYDLKL
ncbi:MAG: hypothetical protein WCS17_08755 [Prevotella sp.]|jgi:hypothetical protein